MRTLLLTIMALAVTAPVPAVEFLGVDLCGDPLSTAIVLPEGSPLVVKSVEAGAQGGLVILFATEEGDPLHNVDALMEAELGRAGSGDESSLTWTGADVVAYAQPISQTYAALAIRGGAECTESVRASQEPSPQTASETAVADTPSPTADVPESTAEATSSAETPPPAPAAAQPAASAGAATPPPAPPKPDFELQGDLRHEAAADDWVDVMGVVANHTADGYKLATFDVSLYDAAGELICVDTISVSVLKPGQERAFRDAIRCPGYDPAAVKAWKLQFAGGF